jgi:hypothetical protein
MTKRDRIQHLLITHLLKEGKIRLVLPDGMVVEMGLTQEGKDGRDEVRADYCWISSTQDHRKMFMDCNSLSVQYQDDGKRIVVEDSVEENGEQYKFVDVV